MFGKFFKAIGKGAFAVIKVAAPVAIAAIEPGTMINTFVAGAAKHSKILRGNNNAIPYLNMLASTGLALFRNMGVYGDLGTAIMPSLMEGLALAGGSTLLHQSVKIPMRDMIKTPAIASAVGPGEKFSL